MRFFVFAAAVFLIVCVSSFTSAQTTTCSAYTYCGVCTMSASCKWSYRANATGSSDGYCIPSINFCPTGYTCAYSNCPSTWCGWFNDNGCEVCASSTLVDCTWCNNGNGQSYCQFSTGSCSGTSKSTLSQCDNGLGTWLGVSLGLAIFLVVVLPIVFIITIVIIVVVVARRAARNRYRTQQVIVQSAYQPFNNNMAPAPVYYYQPNQQQQQQPAQGYPLQQPYMPPPVYQQQQQQQQPYQPPQL